jgi:hypothetical protein
MLSSLLWWAMGPGSETFVEVGLSVDLSRVYYRNLEVMNTCLQPRILP